MKKHKSTKKIYLAVSSVLFLCLIAATVIKTDIFRSDKQKNQQITTAKSPDSQTPKPEQKIDNSPARPNDNESINAKKESDPQQNTQPEINSKGTATITRLSQDDDGVVRARVMITGFGNSGSCTASYTNNSEEINTTSEVVNNGSYASCGALDTKIEKFPRSAEWKVSVKVTNGTSIINSGEQFVTISK